MELYIVFYQITRLGFYDRDKFCICKSQEEAKRKFLDFICDIKSTIINYKGGYLSEDVYEITSISKYTNTDTYEFRAVICMSKIPFNVFFNL